MPTSPQPYTIHVADSRLDRLQQKLDLVDLPDELDNGQDWNMGVPLSDMKRLVSHWKDGFDWRRAEAELNRLPQYLVDVEVDGFGTVEMHYVHAKAEAGRANAIPLLFVHGWPGSFVEVTKLIEGLVRGGDGRDTPVFDVVAPSLPNFGFSQGITKRGFGFAQMAEACHKVMLALGHDQYVTQGGDLGYAVTRWCSLLFPQSCRANHLNMALPAQPTLTTNPALFARMQTTPLSEAEKSGLARGRWFDEEGSGYMREHTTKPQTLGYALADSPVGLLAWIYEKLRDWTDRYKWSDDEILTWISIYYFSTAGPAAAQRIYYEGIHANRKTDGSEWERAGEWIEGSKVGVMRLPKELGLFPKLWAQGMGQVVFESEYEDGGHFAAWEKPEYVVQDLRKMYGRGGGAEGVVEGKTGYGS